MINNTKTLIILAAFLAPSALAQEKPAPQESVNTQPVSGALYAKVHSSYGCRTIFYGTRAAPLPAHSSKIHWCMNKGYVQFFDSKGNILCAEKISYDEVVEHSDRHKIMDLLGQRLTVKSNAVKAEVYSVKAPGHQGIDLFDAHNNCIARTKLGYKGKILKVNDPLTEEVINELKDVINNPEDLKTMKICLNRGDELIRPLNKKLRPLSKIIK